MKLTDGVAISGQGDTDRDGRGHVHTDSIYRKVVTRITVQLGNVSRMGRPKVE